MDMEKLKNDLIVFWKVWNQNTTLIFDNLDGGTPGCFNSTTREVKIYNSSLIRSYHECREEGIDISLLHFALLILAHEIGHSLDEKLKPIHLSNGKMLYKAYKLERNTQNENLFLSYVRKYHTLCFFDEIRAWKLAKKILRNKIEKETFYKVMRICLSSYLDRFKEEYELRKKEFLGKL